MALSWEEASATAGQSTVAVNIAYLDKTDIHLEINDVEVNGFTWASDTLINIPSTITIAEGDKLSIIRKTDRTALRLLFSEGAAFTRGNIDEQNDQFLYLAQELVEGRSIDGFYGDISMNGYRIIKVGTPKDGGDAANKSYVDLTVGAALDTALANTAAEIKDTVRTVNTPLNPIRGSLANTVLGFDSQGQPYTVTLSDGSAQDILAKLADLSGASLIGTAAASNVQDTLDNLAVSILETKSDLANTDDPSLGDALLGVKQPFTGAVDRTQHDKNQEIISVADFGASGDGVKDDTKAIQDAIDNAPNGYTLYFPGEKYLVGNLKISKPLVFLGRGFLQAGTQLINKSATEPTFSATGINNIQFIGFYLTSSIARTLSATGFIDLVKCHRVVFQSCFFEEYYLAVSYDGGTEITFDCCEGFTTKNGTGSGFAWFGRNNYTGSISFNNCYLKVDDAATTLPEFGIRFGYVDVAFIDGSNTIIRHGHDVEVVPNGSSQFAHLIKISSGILDTATSGLFVQPINGANADVELTACYSAAMSGAAWIIDGSFGTVTATINGGNCFSNGVSGLDITGAGATVFLYGTRFANNQIAIHVTNNATLYADSPAFGDFDNSVGNQYPWAIDSTSKGWIKNPVLRNNFNDGVCFSSSFDICDVWQTFSPSVTAAAGTLGQLVVNTCRYKITSKSVEYEITLTAPNNSNLGADGLIISLPRPCRTHLVGTGRNISQGPMLQCIADPAAGSMLVVSYDNSHPIKSASNVLVMRAIYEIV